MTYFNNGLCAAAALLLTATLTSQAATATTGDLGPNIVTGAAPYTWSPNITAPDGTANGTLTVQHGLFNGAPVTVQVSVNGTSVGSFTSDTPAFLGLSSANFNIGALLVNGANTISISSASSPSEFIVASVTVNYDLVEPPQPPSIPVSTNRVSISSKATVFHYLARAPLSSPEGSTITGDLRLQFNKQKNSSLQKFDLKARGLGAGSNYTLVAVTETETNAVATLKSDKHGRLNASYMDKGQGKSNGKKAFPAELDPVTELRAIGLLDGTTTVAWASVESGNYQFLLKRVLTPADTNGTAVGTVAMKGNTTGVSFRLGAGGLVAGEPYHLALNSSVSGSLLADADGRVGFVGWPLSAPSLFDLESIALLNGSSNVVLSTTLP